MKKLFFLAAILLMSATAIKAGVKTDKSIKSRSAQNTVSTEVQKGVCIANTGCILGRQNDTVAIRLKYRVAASANATHYYETVTLQDTTYVRIVNRATNLVIDEDLYISNVPITSKLFDHSGECTQLIEWRDNKPFLIQHYRNGRIVRDYKIEGTQTSGTFYDLDGNVVSTYSFNEVEDPKPVSTSPSNATSTVVSTSDSTVYSSASDSVMPQSGYVPNYMLKSSEVEEPIFMVVEKMPEFPGGQNALFKFLSENVKYPKLAQENGIQGRVICQFIINTDGTISDVKVVRSGGDASLDAEAERVIKSMPRWKPGKQRGKPVRVKYTVPINFGLQ